METSSHHSNQQLPVLVFGDGSASVFLIAQLIKNEESIIWVKDSGSQVWPVMPHVKSELALSCLMNGYQALNPDVSVSRVETGVTHRVFRNKGFKPPVWKRYSDLDQQQKGLEESVWNPEQAYLGIQEYRSAELNPVKIEQELRLMMDSHPHVQKVEMAPVVEFEVFDQGGKLQFSNGKKVEFKQLYYCGPLSELKSIPKLSTVMKAQVSKAKVSSSVSALQVVFHHSKALKQNFANGLMIPMNRDSGEKFDRDVLGYFAEPNRSIWTVFLEADEIEENHEIMKKLRKMKQALNKAFDSPEFLPENCKDFLSTIEKEQVRFEPGYLVTEGEFKTSAANADYVLLNDSFGLTHALEQIATRFDLQKIEFNLDSEVCSEMTVSLDSIPDAPLIEAQF